MMGQERRVTRTEDFLLQAAKFGVALSWDAHPAPRLDLDLQAVGFNAAGTLVDAVYYNNLKALGCGLTHSGDETTGVKNGFDEIVWVDVNRLPSDVALIVFVTASYRGGTIGDARNAHVHILEKTHEVGKFSLANTAGEAALVGYLLRGPTGWMFRHLDVSARRGHHFIDILEPTIGDLIRTVIPAAPNRIKAAFAMDKGVVVDLPESSVVRHACAALGWDTTMGEVDLDVSAILLNGDAKELGCCYFDNREAQGVKHSGDNLTGEGSGDDETITIDLQALAPNVQQIFFVINIYTPDKTFAQVANPFCRIFTADGEEFCRYQLAEAGDQQALMMARLFREPGNSRWGVQALGVPCKGRTYKDSMPEVIEQARTRPQDFVTQIKDHTRHVVCKDACWSM